MRQKFCHHIPVIITSRHDPPRLVLLPTLLQVILLSNTDGVIIIKPFHELTA
jgi:hypothetical protein